MTDDRTRCSIEAIWRIEAPRLMATLVRLVGDVGLAGGPAGTSSVT